jgi:hypothetical protein
MSAVATAQTKNGNGRVPAGELMNISQISRRIKLDRATTVKRLEANGFEPVDVKAKEKTFRLDAVMLAQLSIKNDERLAAQIRKDKAAAEKIEMQNAQSRGELVAMNEVIEIVQKIVSSIYQEFTVRQPKRIAPKLVKAKNVAAVKKALKADTDRIMQTLRENHEKFIA